MHLGRGGKRIRTFKVSLFYVGQLGHETNSNEINKRIESYIQICACCQVHTGIEQYTGKAPGGLPSAGAEKHEDLSQEMKVE